MVYHGNAHHTPGGLTKKKYLTAKKERRLAKHGYRTRKGKFGSFKKTARKRRGAIVQDCEGPVCVKKLCSGKRKPWGCQDLEGGAAQII